MSNDFQHAASVAKDVITAIAVSGTGLWALWNFVIHREAFAKIQFTVELNVLGSLDDRLLVEVVALLENKGAVRHKISNITFNLLYLPESARVLEGKAFNGQVQFQKAGADQRPWVSSEYEYTFVDPKVTQRYSYTASLPQDAAFAIVHARFSYSDKESDFHSAQQVFNVRSRPAIGP